MIRRLRSPDGTSRDIDYGPGPVGTRSHGGLAGVSMAQAVPPRVTGLWPPSTKADREAKRRYEERHRR